MIAFLLVLLTAAITFALAFAIAFTAVSLFIAWKRRDIPKYAYSKPADPYEVRRDRELDRTSPESSVDGSAAAKNWKKN